MQIELSDTMMHVLAVALVWCLVCHGSGHVVGNWFYWRENRRREREAERRENPSWSGGVLRPDKKTDVQIRRNPCDAEKNDS